MSMEIGETGKKSVQAIVEIQKEIFDNLERMNRDWFVRAREEANAACELATKMATVRSVPDTAGIYQQWMTRRMEMFSEDSQRYFADSQKFMQSTARLLSNGWAGNSR
jgi:hypothetical protein